MLKIEDLHAGYGELQVLNGIDLEVKNSEIVALIGPNGAGKSTVIKSVFNISDVRQGKITFKGENITGLETHQLIQKGISYINQGRVIFDTLNVEENLRISAETIADEEKIQERIEKVYQQFPPLKERKDSRAYELSGGQRQMLALGRGLMQDPEILLLDEPSLGLAPKLQKELFQKIKELKEQEDISLLIVEQNAKKAIEIADRTYLLENGKIALEGGEDILENEKIQQVYLGGY